MVEAEIKALRDLVSGLHLRVVALEEEVAQLKGRNHDAPASGRASESEFSLVEEVRPSSGYQSLAAQVPPCPSFALGLCSALRGGRLSAIQRAERAWEAGVWAKFTLQGKIAKPRPSQPIDLSNSIDVVLRAEGFSCPLVAEKASDYRSVVGDFTGSSISHGFASKAEAKTYCLGADVEFPATVYRWR